MLHKLLLVKMQMVRGSLRSDVDGRYRGPLFLGLSAIFWVGLYRSSLWLVGQGLQIQPVGELLIQRLLSLAFLIFTGLLFFSNIVTVFSTMYLADDLEFLMAQPIPKDAMFTSRFLESLLQSSWVIVIFGLPLFIAAGVGIGAEPLYYVALLGVLLPFVAIPTGFAAILSLGITNILAANRTRDAMLVLGLVAFVVLFVVVRSLQPERLLNPETFDSIGEVIDLLSTPATSYLPGDWSMAVLGPLLFDSSAQIDWHALGLLYTTPVALFFIAIWLHRPFYHRGYSKAQEGRHGPSLLTVVRDWAIHRAQEARGGIDAAIAGVAADGEQRLKPLRQLIIKDRAIFFRDASQWSQLLVVLAIMIIYLVNYKYFEIAADQKLFGEVGLFFFNLAACGFVVVALAGRFLFPAVSVEGRSFWLILQAPVSLEKFLLGKWIGSMAPVVVVGQLLVWLANVLVAQSLFLCIAGSLIVLSLSIGVSGMAVGFGAVYPQFHNPNAARIASSFGAVIYMILGMFVVLLMLAMTFRTTMHYGALIDGKEAWPIRSFHPFAAALGFVVPLVAAWLSIRAGVSSLRRRM